MSTHEAVTGLQSGLRAIQARDFQRSEKYQQQLMRANRDGADERLVRFENRFITRLQKLHVPMFAHVFVRSEAEQAVAYRSGNSRAKPGQSPHQYGCAVDIIHGIKGWELARDEPIFEPD